MARRILYITDTGEIRGGGEISLLLLLQNICRNKYIPVVGAPTSGSFTEQISALGIKVKKFNYRKITNLINIVVTLKTIKHLCEIIDEEKINLVHTNSTGGVVLLASIACLLKHTPLVCHTRLLYPGFLTELIQIIFAKKIVAISQAVAKKPLYRLFSNKVVCIYNGLELPVVTDKIDKEIFIRELGLSENIHLVGCVGSYTPGKGLEYFIRAIAVLRERLPNVKAVVVGIRQQAHEDYIKQLHFLVKKLKLKNHIFFLPFQKEINRFYSAIDVLAFCSLGDAFGRAVIEAMAFAKPVVAFASGGVVELIEEAKTGFLVKKGNFKELAQRLEIILSDKTLAEQLGKQGRQRCEDLFDIRLHTQRIEDLYAEVLEESYYGYVNCALCGANNYFVLTQCKVTAQDTASKQYLLRLCCCRRCGLVYVNPQPKVTDEFYSENYFNAEYMKFYSGDTEGAFQSNEPFDWRKGMIEKYIKAGRILDIGCASGEFLSLMQKNGWIVTGVDISEYAVQTARNRYQLDVRKGTIFDMDFSDSSFDVVSAGDILEHIPNPYAFLCQIRRILKKDGFLYIATPNFKSVHYRLAVALSRFNHKNYFVLPHHLFHFTPQTLTGILKKAGFVVKEMQLKESTILEKGWRRQVMKIVFLLGRFLQAQDRIIIIAQNTRDNGDKRDS
ncbi:MAG: glycosyltransferase [Candidatus Omnitrophica bacterium]|nr:glycosyltransferase [Candidatus Omnitrophota bacterium]